MCRRPRHRRFCKPVLPYPSLPFSESRACSSWPERQTTARAAIERHLDAVIFIPENRLLLVMAQRLGTLRNRLVL